MNGPVIEQPLPPRGGRLVISAATLGGIGASLVLLVWQLAMEAPLRTVFLGDNSLGRGLRLLLLATIAIGAALPIAVAAVVRLVRGPRSEAPLFRFATLTAPLLLAFWLPSLFEWQTAQRKPLVYLVLLSLFVSIARPLIRRSLEEQRNRRAERPASWPHARWRSRSWPPLAAVAVAACGYIVYTAYLTIWNHRLGGTSALDLGVYDNFMFNALHGRPFRCTVLQGLAAPNEIARGAEFATLLFVPLYALHPSAETLLFVQALMLGLAAIPLYLFAARLLSRGAALLLALAYLMFAPLHGPYLSSFHALPIAIFFHFWLYYAIAARKSWLVAPCVVVLLAIHVDVALGLVFLGFFLLVTGIRVRLGSALVAVSALWFLVDRLVFIPRFGGAPAASAGSALAADKAVYATLFPTLFGNPMYALTSLVRANKVEYGLHMLAPLAFVPLRRVAFLLLLLPGAAFTLMATAYWPTSESAFPHTAQWIPYLFLATVLGLFVMRYEPASDSKRRAALAVLVIAVLSHSYDFGAVFQPHNFRGVLASVVPDTPENRQRYAQLVSLLPLIPEQASVAASDHVVPHVSNRLDVYTARYESGPVDYLLLSSKELSGEPRRVIRERLQRVAYGLVRRAGEFYLFKRGLDSAATDAALRELGLAR